MNNRRQPINAGSRSSDQPATTPHHDVAALTGAAKAFINRLPPDELAKYVERHTPHPPPKPPKPAAARARRASTNSSVPQVSRQDVSSSRSSQSSSQDSLPVPRKKLANASRSPSSIAASLAAARASPAALSTSPRDVRPRAASTATRASADRPDESPIPATTSLVKMFEQNQAPPPAQRPKKSPVVAKKPAVLQSPKPVRRSQILHIDSSPPLFPPNTEQLVHDRLAAKGLLKEQNADQESENADDSASPDSYTSAKEMMSPIKLSKPPLPLPRRSGRQDGGSVVEASSKPEGQLQPPDRNMSGSAPIDIRRPSSSQTASSYAPSNSHTSITAAYNQMHPRRMTPITTGGSLADAIVASSLASSRAHSPHKAPPMPAPRHKANSISHSLFSRSVSPPKKGMRHTMRKWSSESSESEELPYAKHKKKNFLRKHPNKHHEGDRKRWRDAITERERRRYEGVWAANKGLHMFFTPEEQAFLDKHPNTKQAEKLRESVAEQVTDIVARDIFSRSRLSDDVLEQVWDLVDSQNNGRLLKEEFVVALWLIDQCLKGRKLPIKVSESVWNSVKFLHGIKVRK